MPTSACRVALALALGVAAWSIVLPLEARAGIDFRPSAPEEVLPRPVHMNAGDLNKDGRDDLFVVSPASTTLSVLIATGQEGMELPREDQYDLDSDSVKAPALGDLSKDGVLDVAIPFVSAGEIRFFYGTKDAEGNPTGKLTAVPCNGPVPCAAEEFSNPTAVAIANIVKDSPGDLLVAQRGGEVVLAVRKDRRYIRNVTACLGGNNAKVSCTTGPRPGYIWAVDLNRDGARDFVTLNEGGEREKTASVGLGIPDANPPAAPADVYFRRPVEYVVGDLPESPIITDVNADGYLDLVAITVPTVGSTESAVTILFGRADGTFSEPSSFIVTCPYFVGDGSCRGSALSSGDFDGDGDLDLAIALNDPRPEAAVAEKDALLILVGRGNGEFSPGAVLPIGRGVLQLVTGQIGGNALPDLAASSSAQMIVQALVNRSTGGDLGNGEPCEFGDECASSRCIDDVCCATTCLENERCNVPGREGTCLPLPVEPMECTSPTQCATNFCVNGYCCESSCTDGRCDVPDYEGVCIKGRGNGESCTDDRQCESMICSSNSVCCNERCQGGFCDERGICREKLDLGDECNGDLECASNVCDVYNGICCKERCNGETEDCNPDGQCVPLDATPTPTRTPRPTPAANGETCSVEGDCASTFCVNDICCAVSECGPNQHCAAGSGQCVAGGTPTPTRTPTALPTENPCDPSPCAPGQRCIVGAGNEALCVSTSSSGGCETTGGRSGSLLFAAAMPLFLLLGRRWQLQRDRARSRAGAAPSGPYQ